MQIRKSSSSRPRRPRNLKAGRVKRQKQEVLSLHRVLPDQWESAVYDGHHSTGFESSSRSEKALDKLAHKTKGSGII